MPEVILSRSDVERVGETARLWITDEVQRMGVSAAVVEDALDSTSRVLMLDAAAASPSNTNDLLTLHAWQGEDGDFCVWGTHNPNKAFKAMKQHAYEVGFDDFPSVQDWGLDSTKYWGRPGLELREEWDAGDWAMRRTNVLTVPFMVVHV